MDKLSHIVIPLVLLIQLVAGLSSMSTITNNGLADDQAFSLTDSVNQLSLSFHKTIQPYEDNVVFSPLSITIGLGMLLEATRGPSQQEIIRFLTNGRNVTDLTDLRRQFKDVLQRYSFSNPSQWQLEMANLAMLAKGYQVKGEFKSNLENFFGALVTNEDFKANGSLLVDQINQFVSLKTKNLIKKALDGPLDPETKFLLINTVSFDGEWVRRFVKSMVIQRKFYSRGNVTSKVAFMTQTTRTNYGEIKEKQMKMIELEYHGNASMFIFLPDQRYGLADLVRNLTVQEIDSYIGGRLKRNDIDIEIPKFTFQVQYDLVERLKAFGLSRIFTNRADYSGITENSGLGGDLRLTGAVHKSVIKVDEKGTKAAAFTGFGFHPLSVIFGQVQFIADHPFLFIIRDKSTGINMFSGAVNKLSVA